MVIILRKLNKRDETAAVAKFHGTQILALAFHVASFLSVNSLPRSKELMLGT